MIRLTVEEMNLLSIYHEGSKAQLMENMTTALPFMDEDMRPFAERTLQKISPLTENEYAEISIFAADEVWPGVSGSRRHRAGKSTAL